MLALCAMLLARLSFDDAFTVVRIGVQPRAHGNASQSSPEELYIFHNASEADIASVVQHFCAARDCDPGDRAFLLAECWMRSQLLNWHICEMRVPQLPPAKQAELPMRLRYRSWADNDPTIGRERVRLHAEVRMLYHGDI